MSDAAYWREWWQRREVERLKSELASARRQIKQLEDYVMVSASEKWDAMFPNAKAPYWRVNGPYSDALLRVARDLDALDSQAPDMTP